MPKYDYLIVGAGLFGCVVAEQLAKKNKKILIIDSRNHLGGNCHSEIDQRTGIEFHTYGTHIFHTQSLELWDYVNSFTPFKHQQHHVVARIGHDEYPLPFNLDTFSLFFKKNFTATTLKDFLQQETQQFAKIENLEQQALSMVGKKFYEAFIKGYTEKHWGVLATQLPSSILKRVPIYFDSDRNYFKRSKHQGLPQQGYAALFSAMTDSRNIEVELNTDFFSLKDRSHFQNIIYTGPLDRYFNNCFGELQWRGITLTKEYLPYPSSFHTSVCNFPQSNISKTRTHIPRLLHPERQYQNVEELLLHETSCDGRHAPFYPIRLAQQMEQLQKYEQLKAGEENTFFGGRLASYAYVDMDQTISQALSMARTLE